MSMSLYATHSDRAYVTVDDVLEAIYRTLRANVTHEEYAALPTERDIHSVASAYEERYRRVRGEREYQEEKRRGVRRVDYLMGRTTFMGLSVNGKGTRRRGRDGDMVCVLNTR